jgi:radical SAM superfamily enzyme YgiQ (UPF0313 family)
MFQAGFTTIRLGLETAAFANRDDTDHKVTKKEFSRAVFNLLEVGFDKSSLGAYLLVGLPGQTMESVEDSIDTVKQKGITPVLAYYSPIPHTKMWKRAVISSDYDLEADPVFTNNAILPCHNEKFSWQRISYLKNLC